MPRRIEKADAALAKVVRERFGSRSSRNQEWSRSGDRGEQCASSTAAKGASGVARSGAVDYFRSQEAPFSIYPLATSTPEDMRRGLKFCQVTILRRVGPCLVLQLELHRLLPLVGLM